MSNNFNIFSLENNNCEPNLHRYDDDDDDEKEEEEDEDERGPALEIYGTDLTVLAQEGKLEECFGREKELSALMEILVRRQKNNPVLVGAAGVGKTAIVELFATKIVSNLVPFILEGRSIVSTDLARIVAGSRYRGEFELRFQRILDEVLSQPHIIIFIDEIHNISGAGSAEGSLDAANILKPVLSRSGFQCIGATTTKEYQRIEKDPALNRRFQPVKVNEPSVEETVHILYGLRPTLEAFHNLEILPGALQLSVDLASRYIYDRFLPDKAIDLVDRAAAREVIRLTNVTHGSVIGSLVNASLNNIGILRMEAFRRSDIAAEFIFQEIENAYRNFLLRWIENPTEIEDPLDTKTEARILLSPISESLFTTMKFSVLKRVEDLLFSSSKRRYEQKKIRRIKELSIEKNQEIYNMFVETAIKGEFPKLSIYRISLFLFKEWVNIEEIHFSTSAYKNKLLEDCLSLFHIWKMGGFIESTYEKLELDPISFSIVDDFCEEDIEVYEYTFERLSQMEEKRIEIFKEFLNDLKPLLKKGIIESLSYSSDLKMSENELSTIYNLLGYFSTDTGRDFISNLDDPDLICRARKLGDFRGLKTRIKQEDIRELLAEITGIPVQSISKIESQKLLNLETILHKRVVGQEEAISAISKAIRRSRLGIQNPNRPIASFLFCGPTGVGKTEVTKALAVSMFGAESDMIRFDMSEFMEKFTVSRLIGSPPGYVGYDEGGQLTDSVRRKPYSVVLFDEVEKAHPDILNILLQILEDGRLTDSQKRLVPFENTVIVMTSNAAADEIQQILKNDHTLDEVFETSFYEKENIPKKEIITNFIDGEIIELEKSESVFTKDKKEETDDGKTTVLTKRTKKDVIIYQDDYAGAIEFLKSPIDENFFVDIRKELEKEFVKSFRNLTEFQGGESEINKLRALDEQKIKREKLINTLKSAVFERLSTIFLPEFLNRLDDIIIFQPLRPEELRKICDIMINEVTDRVKSKKILLTVDASVRLKLAEEGYNPAFGARPLRRLITKHVEDLISENILKNPVTNRARIIKIQLNEYDQIVVKKENEENKKNVLNLKKLLIKK